MKNFWSLLYERSQTKMMYRWHVLGDGVMYFVNTISEPEKLIEFIEQMQENPDSYKYFSEWKTQAENVKYKEFYSQSDTDRISQKCLYIKNTFERGINFCKDIYIENNNIVAESIDDIKMYKEKLFINNEPQSYIIPTDESKIYIYSLLNTSATGRAFCVNFEKNIYIYPEPNSMLFIPGNLKHSVCLNEKDEMYYVTSSFAYTQKELS